MVRGAPARRRQEVFETLPTEQWSDWSAGFLERVLAFVNGGGPGAWLLRMECPLGELNAMLMPMEQ